MAKPKQPSKDYKWDTSKKKWVLKSFEERQKGRPFYLQGVNNPIRVVHDNIRNANAAKKVRREAEAKTEQKKNNLKTPKVESVGTVDFNVNTASGLAAYNKALKASKGKRTDKERDASTTEALHGKRNRAEAEKRKHRPKPGSAAGRIQKRLRKAGFTQDELDNLGSKHRAWKAARKAGTLGDWEEKYHPGRGKYKNKNKTKAKIEKKSTNPIKQNLQTVAEKVKKKKARNPVEMMFGR